MRLTVGSALTLGDDMIPSSITKFFEDVRAHERGAAPSTAPLIINLDNESQPFYLELDEDLEVAESRPNPQVVLRNTKATDNIHPSRRTYSYTEVSPRFESIAHHLLNVI